MEQNRRVKNILLKLNRFIGLRMQGVTKTMQYAVIVANRF